MTARCLLTAEAVMVALRRAIPAAAVVLGLAGCDDLLNVSNPGSLQEGQLDDPALEQFIVNGAIGEFQFAYAHYAFWSGVLADEGFTDHTNQVFGQISLHSFDDQNLTNETVYANLQRARRSADDAADRVKKMQGANAASSLNLARALIYGGYTYVLLAEGFCDAPVNLSAPLSPTELFARGIARFDEGITVATAAAARPADSATAQALVNLARVGAARASLKKGDPVNARAHALAVPDTFGSWAYYSANSERQYNPVRDPVRESTPWFGMHPSFQGLGDARVPQPATSRISFRGRPISPPMKPSMYSGWTGTGPAQTIEVSTHIRFASGLEARYIRVEADGANAAMLTFVNERRAVAGKPAVQLSDALLVKEFRLQRALDFYLTGQRLGDLRRYAAGGTDLFPSGTFPMSTEIYGTMHCFIVPQSEKTGNPHY